MRNKEFGFKVAGVCLECFRELTPREFEQNWRKGDIAIFCDCPKCGYVMEPRLRVFRFDNLRLMASVPYYNASFIQWQLRILLRKKPKKRTTATLLKDDPALYWNVLKFYSSLRSAFAATRKGSALTNNMSAA